jgi:hypothetical protein
MTAPHPVIGWESGVRPVHARMATLLTENIA